MEMREYHNVTAADIIGIEMNINGKQKFILLPDTA